MTPRLTATLATLVFVSAAFAPSATGTTIQMKGSDTIGGELGPAWAEAYMLEHPEAQVAVEALGSSTGFAGLFDGTAHIAASSRPIRGSEMKQAQQLGLSLREMVIGYDGIAVVVHPDNPVDALTIPQVSALFSGAIRSWSEVGGPDLAVRVVSRPSYSGTHGFFKKRVLRHNGDTSEAEFASGTVWAEKNDEIIDIVGSDPRAVSYLGLGWLDPAVHTIAIRPSDGGAPTKPSLESVREGRYAISRPLRLYTVGTPEDDVRSFLAFVFSAEGQQLVRRHGFVPTDMTPPFAPADSSRSADPAPLPTVRIFFGTSRSSIDAAGRAKLADVARRARGDGFKVIITGHGDSIGSPAAIRRVALARARTVSAELVRRGVPVDLIHVTSEGADRPIATNTTAEGRRQNRRVDIQLVRLD